MNRFSKAAAAVGLLSSSAPAAAHSGPAHAHLAGGAVIYAAAVTAVLAAAWLLSRIGKRRGEKPAAGIAGARDGRRAR